MPEKCFLLGAGKAEWKLACSAQEHGFKLLLVWLGAKVILSLDMKISLIVLDVS